MDRGVLIGIIGGAIIFIISSSFIISINSDFDTQLINQINEGVSPDTLLLQIDNETHKMLVDVDRRYEVVVMDKKYWGDGNLGLSENFQYYTQNYENDIKMVYGMAEVRKKYARGEIDKKEFLTNIAQYKEYFKLY